MLGNPSNLCSIQDFETQMVPSCFKFFFDCSKRSVRIMRDQIFYVLQHDTSWMVIIQDFQDLPEHVRSLVVKSFSLSGHAEWLARKSSRQDIVGRNL